MVSNISGVASQSTDDAGFDRFVELDGLLDADERADADFGEAFAGADDDFDVFALFASGGEEREIAEFAEHAADFRLEDDDRAEDEDEGGITQQPTQDFEFEQCRRECSGEQENGEPDDHRPAARAPDEARGQIDSPPRGWRFPTRAAKRPE
jgi:hypothetical protein